MTLQCSSYVSADAAIIKSRSMDSTLPAVVYCHSNGGSRLDARELVDTMVPLGFKVVAFDFSVSVKDMDYSSAKLRATHTCLHNKHPHTAWA